MKGLWHRLRRVLAPGSQRDVFASRINSVSLTAAGSVRKHAGPVFHRGPHRFDPRQLLEREAIFLKRLNGRHAPRLLDVGRDWIEMDHCGLELTIDNRPHDWRDQVHKIATTLGEAGIVHRDIKQGNVLVKDGSLYLIDFGWAVWTEEEPFLSPRELCNDVPRRYIYDNRAALDWLLSSFDK